jgi:hypothetical protein
MEDLQTCYCAVSFRELLEIYFRCPRPVLSIFISLNSVPDMEDRDIPGMFKTIKRNAPIDPPLRTIDKQATLSKGALSVTITAQAED